MKDADNFLFSSPLLPSLFLSWLSYWSQEGSSYFMGGKKSSEMSCFPNLFWSYFCCPPLIPIFLIVKMKGVKLGKSLIRISYW